MSGMNDCVQSTSPLVKAMLALSLPLEGAVHVEGVQLVRVHAVGEEGELQLGQVGVQRLECAAAGECDAVAAAVGVM
ncbi:hypothetical protein, partial [Streptomyces prunicolor]|uniref:hypothetical protein n=1 Tax=Streptomyces prunicolor TaxID=67348 RepID=UPI0033FA086B